MFLVFDGTKPGIKVPKFLPFVPSFPANLPRPALGIPPWNRVQLTDIQKAVRAPSVWFTEIHLADGCSPLRDPSASRFRVFHRDCLWVCYMVEFSCDADPQRPRGLLKVTNPTK